MLIVDVHHERHRDSRSEYHHVHLDDQRQELRVEFELVASKMENSKSFRQIKTNSPIRTQSYGHMLCVGEDF